MSKRCRECDADLVVREDAPWTKRYCSPWCVEAMWRREFPERAAVEPTIIGRLLELQGLTWADLRSSGRSS